MRCAVVREGSRDRGRRGRLSDPFFIAMPATGVMPGRCDAPTPGLSSLLCAYNGHGQSPALRALQHPTLHSQAPLSEDALLSGDEHPWITEKEDLPFSNLLTKRLISLQLGYAIEETI